MPDTRIHLCVPFGVARPECPGQPMLFHVAVTPAMVARIRALAGLVTAAQLNHAVVSLDGDATNALPTGVYEQLDQPFVISAEQSRQIPWLDGTPGLALPYIRDSQACVTPSEWFVRCYDDRTDAVFETISVDIPPPDVFRQRCFCWTHYGVSEHAEVRRLA